MTALDQLKAELTERVTSFVADLRKEIAAEILDKLGASEAPPHTEQRVVKTRTKRAPAAPKQVVAKDPEDHEEELDEDVDAIIERSVAARRGAKGGG